MLSLILFLYQIAIILQTGAADEWENCTAPTVQNVDLAQIIGKVFYIVWQTINVGGQRQNFTLTADDNPPTHGYLIINTLNGTSKLPWLSYSNGVIIYKLENTADQPENYMAFLFYNGMPSAQSFAALDCLNNTYYEEHNNQTLRMPLKQPKNLMVGTTIRNPNQDYVSALKQQALAADPGLQNSTFYDME